MLKIDPFKVELKYKIGFTKINPSKYDLLYELAEFLQNENKEEFNEWELKNKTKSRVPNLEENVKTLIDEGFISKEKYTKYKLLKHLWM